MADKQHLEKLIECSICLDQLRDPKMLPCQHTFCRECLEKIPPENKQGSFFIDCPNCRTPIQLPANGDVTKLPPSIMVNNLLDMYRAGIVAGNDHKEKQDEGSATIPYGIGIVGTKSQMEELREENKQLQNRMRVLEDMQFAIDEKIKIQQEEPTPHPPNMMPHPPPHYDHYPPPHHSPPWRHGHRPPPPHHRRHHPPPPGHHPPGHHPRGPPGHHPRSPPHGPPHGPSHGPPHGCHRGPRPHRGPRGHHPPHHMGF